MASDDPGERLPWMPASEKIGEEPYWDSEYAEVLVGQYVLLGITYLASDGETVTSQLQCHGRVAKADESGIAILCEGETWRGTIANLPPDLRPIRPASPGEYRLRSTGEVVENPDLLVAWTMTEAPKLS
ncbi:MAG: hypothetical protein AB7U47_02120 [Variibacter sp.]